MLAPLLIIALGMLSLLVIVLVYPLKPPQTLAVPHDDEPEC
jgi:hypothetical protein